MNIVQITPGAGAMYCGNCLRDNALVAALSRLGHQVTMLPMYLPLTLDEADQSAGLPIFFGGINVYLEQKFSWFRGAPGWLRRALASRRLLKWAAGRAAKTRAGELGELTFSMLAGETGHQAQELETLVTWLKTQPRADVICLSNALLLGLAPRLRRDLGVPVVCMLQGEDTFLDALPPPYRERCWQKTRELAAQVEMCVAPSHYYALLMRERLGLPTGSVRVVHNGINLEGYRRPESAPGPGARDEPAAAAVAPVLGYFTRMCREKGLDRLVTAFIATRRRGRAAQLRLRIGGSCGPADEPLVAELRQQLRAAGLLEAVEFCPNLDRAGKLAFLRSLTLFCVPAHYGEAFGLYVLEAMAAGVPVVLPRTGAFPELVEATGGGALCAADDTEALADALEQLAIDPERACRLGIAGQRAVFSNFSAQAMAEAMAGLFGSLRANAVAA